MSCVYKQSLIDVETLCLQILVHIAYFTTGMNQIHVIYYKQSLIDVETLCLQICLHMAFFCNWNEVM